MPMLSRQLWAAQPGGAGDNVPPPTFGTNGVQGSTGGGPMKMIFASTADSLYSFLFFILYYLLYKDVGLHFSVLS